MKHDPIILSAPVEIQGAATGNNPKRLRVLAYSGGVMRGIPGYGDVIVDTTGLKIPPSVPILAEHENSLAAVLGAGKASVVKGTVEVVVTLAENEQAASVLALLESGVELQASVGVSPATVKVLRSGETVKVNGQSLTIGGAGATLVLAGTLKEITLCPLGCDPETAVRIAAKRAVGVLNMADETTTTLTGDAAIQVADLTRDHPTIRARALSEQWTAERTELEVLRAKASTDKYEAELAKLRGSRAPAALCIASDSSGAKTRDILASAVLIHAGHANIAEKHFGAMAVSMADGQRSRTLLDIFASGLRLEHRDIPRDRSELIRAAFSTTSMPIALGLSAEKLALDAYKTTAPTWRQFCRVVPCRNFKETSQIRPIFGGDGFQPVGNGGELKHMAMAEQVFVIHIDTHGELLGITRQNIIDDDLGLFDQTATAMGRDGARAVSDLVYKTMLNNLEPDGTTTFFTEARESLIVGTGTVLSLNALSNAVSALRRRRDPNGRSIDIVPKVLLVPPELESNGRALLSSTQISRISSTDSLPQGNPFLGQLELAVEPRLSNTQFHASASALAWYVVGAPTDGAVTVGFLDGRDSPVVEQVDGPMDVLGIFWRGYLDLGASLSDYRGIVRMKGAA